MKASGNRGRVICGALGAAALILLAPSAANCQTDQQEKGEDTVGDLEVRIVDLEPMRMASVYAYSEHPEQDAWGKLEAWAKPKGLFDDLDQHPVFGFYNPDPSPESKEYGYEFWIKAGPDVKPEGDVRIEGFKGGRYAVASCKGIANITKTWKELREWLKKSDYREGGHQWLEEQTSEGSTPDDLVLDLYLPITERNETKG